MSETLRKVGSALLFAAIGTLIGVIISLSCFSPESNDSEYKSLADIAAEYKATHVTYIEMAEVVQRVMRDWNIDMSNRPIYVIPAGDNSAYVLLDDSYLLFGFTRKEDGTVSYTCTTESGSLFD